MPCMLPVVRLPTRCKMCGAGVAHPLFIHGALRQHFHAHSPQSVQCTIRRTKGCLLCQICTAGCLRDSRPRLCAPYHYSCRILRSASERVLSKFLQNPAAMAKLIAIAVALLACALPLAAASSRQIPAEEALELANSGRELQQYYNDVGEVMQEFLHNLEPPSHIID